MITVRWRGVLCGENLYFFERGGEGSNSRQTDRQTSVWGLAAGADVGGAQFRLGLMLPACLHREDSGGLITHFFGADGRKKLGLTTLKAFLQDLHDEIARLEFRHYDHADKACMGRQTDTAVKLDESSWGGGSMADRQTLLSSLTGVHRPEVRWQTDTDIAVELDGS
jgi:hypothetical protein